MTLDIGAIAAIGVALSGVLAGVAAIMNARKQRSTANEAELRAEVRGLDAEVKRQRRYIGILYAYAVRSYRRLLAMNATPDPEPVPEEEPTP